MGEMNLLKICQISWRKIFEMYDKELTFFFGHLHHTCAGKHLTSLHFAGIVFCLHKLKDYSNPVLQNDG